MTIYLEPPAYRPGGPDGQGWNRLSLNAHMGTEAPQCALRPRSYRALWISRRNTQHAQWGGGYSSCADPERGRRGCKDCPVLERRTELHSLTPSVLVRIKWIYVGDLVPQGHARPWVMNRPDNGWGEYGQPWSWDDLAALRGWWVCSRPWRDEHSEGFWLHATYRSAAGGAYAYGIGEPIPDLSRRCDKTLPCHPSTTAVAGPPEPVLCPGLGCRAPAEVMEDGTIRCTVTGELFPPETLPQQGQRKGFVLPTPGDLYDPPAIPVERSRATVNNCTTCGTPEAKWDAEHRLYLLGGSQCPLCTKADITEDQRHVRRADA